MTALVLVATLRYHSGPVWSVRWSPSGLLASCGADRKVHIWSSTGGADWKLIATSAPDAFLRAVRDVSWSPDGRSLAASSFDASATVLQLTGGPNPTLEPAVCLEGHDAEVKSVAYSSGGGLLATCSRDRSVWIWQVGLDYDYDCIAVLNSHRGDVKRVVWHPHIEMLISCSFDESVRVWVEDEDDWFCSEELVAHSCTVWDVSFDQSGDALATVSADRSLIVWRREPPPPNVIGGTPRFVVSARVEDVSSEPLYSVDWCKVTDIIAVGGGDDSIQILTKVTDVNSDKVDDVNQVESHMVDRQADDGVNSAINGAARTEAEVEMTTTRLTEKWQVEYSQTRAHTGDVNGVAWSPSHSNTLASCGDDGLVRIWRYGDKR